MKVLPPSNMPWNYKFLTWAFLAGIVVQCAILLGCGQDPAWPFAVIFIIWDVAVLCRAIVARVRGEIGRDWAYYAVLCVLFVQCLSGCLPNHHAPG